MAVKAGEKNGTCGLSKAKSEVGSSGQEGRRKEWKENHLYIGDRHTIDTQDLMQITLVSIRIHNNASTDDTVPTPLMQAMWAISSVVKVGVE